MPHYVYAVEILLLPFFWAIPLLSIIFWATIRADVRGIAKEGVTIHPFRAGYGLPYIAGHFGTFVYRFHRRNRAIESRGFDARVFTSRVRDEVPMYPWLRRLYGVTTGLLLVLLIAPWPAVMVDILLVFLIINMLLGPFAVHHDVRDLRRNGVLWGWMRFAHIVMAALPGGAYPYLIQRREHVAYAKLAEYWDASPDEFQPDGPTSEWDRLRELFRI